MTGQKPNDPSPNKIKPGSTADADRREPLQTEKQQDDNVDDHGNKAGGGKLEQPT